MKRIGKRSCQHCRVFFLPDHRNANRQKFCSEPGCRKASKSASQRQWVVKNPDYFKGSEHVQRVYEWRRNHPGYRRRMSSSSVLQDDCMEISSQKQDVVKHSPPALSPQNPVLQDILITQHPVFIGLIAHMTGVVLQDDIDAVIRRLEQLGRDVFMGSTTTKGGHYDPQIPNLSRPRPQYSRTVQLGGSPSGP